MIKIEITFEEYEDRKNKTRGAPLLKVLKALVFEKLYTLGYSDLYGYLAETVNFASLKYVFLYQPSRRDLIFFKFKTWVPAWERRRNLINSVFRISRSTEEMT